MMIMDKKAVSAHERQYSCAVPALKCGLHIRNTVFMDVTAVLI